jgi:hypothetical protein
MLFKSCCSSLMGLWSLFKRELMYCLYYFDCSYKIATLEVSVWQWFSDVIGKEHVNLSEVSSSWLKISLSSMILNNEYKLTFLLKVEEWLNSY